MHFVIVRVRWVALSNVDDRRDTTFAATGGTAEMAKSLMEAPRRCYESEKCHAVREKIMRCEV